MDIEIGRVSNPLQARSTLGGSLDKGDIVSGFGLNDDPDIRIGGNSFMAITSKKLLDGGFRQRLRTTSSRFLTKLELGEKMIAEKMDNSELSALTRMGIWFLFIPLFAAQCILQIRMFLILLVFNYTGFNFRPYALFHVPTERELTIRHSFQKSADLSVNKINYLVERYMPYWLNVVFFILYWASYVAYQVLDTVYFTSTSAGDDAATIILRVSLVLMVGFANLDPKKIVPLQLCGRGGHYPRFSTHTAERSR